MNGCPLCDCGGAGHAGDRPVVGVLGASGVVGAAAVRALSALGVETFRLGARRPGAVAEVAHRLPHGAAETWAVDLDDPDRLAEFCAGCRVVLNCAGPSYQVRGRVARAALAVGADYVDVAGDEPAHAELSTIDVAVLGRSAVLSAGMLPGLSALLPRWLAERGTGADRATPPGTSHGEAAGGRLTAWTGGLERCSRTVAADLLLSIGTGGPGRAAASAGPVPSYGESLAAWRDGRRVSRALSAEDDAELPFFPGAVAVRPYLSGEAERLARALDLDGLDWFNVFPGHRVRDALGALGGFLAERAGRAGRAEGESAGGPGRALDAAAERLARACELDLVGRRAYYRMVFALESASGATTTAVLGTGDSYRLTATVGALAVASCLAGRVPPGLHYAAEVLDPAETVRLLGSIPGVTLDVSHAPIELGTAVGAL
ncbi:saccharopine dehydrogenase NADP-binding domain-containing protein [Streptomyces sp. NBC_00820]|uniref:saccharopine dehydrogenase NADP-binding domain-containing protein n=1 Tax=Streptomyces sp. NBC_00820 TaxID=2975842 RepID=UPI002ED302F0|nr:saccharopine dehydrogenase NADP-binding domain-containing protein [Streptomyces sp. NBC_00820]